MGKKEKWCWSSALIGAASAIAASTLISAKPKDPSFHLISISFKSFKPNLPIPDAEVILNIHVTNPNIAPIKYSDSTMSIFYQDSLIGKAHLEAGSQPAHSCKLIRLPARLNVLQFAQHAATFVSDVAKREMLLDATVDIGGTAKVLRWDQNFKIHVDSHITVDPMCLDVLDQENTSKLQLFTGSTCPIGDGKCMH